MIDMTAKTATTAEIASELNTTPRELRKFLRASSQGVGKGSRYALPANARDLAKMRKNFASWVEARDAAKSDNTPTNEVSTEPTDEVESDELTEPTDSDLDDITAETD